MIETIDCVAASDIGLDPQPGPEAAPKKRGGGPKTPEGKQRARANAMKHGLGAKVLLPDELVDARDRHRAELDRQFEPRNGYEDWLVGEMAMGMARLDRCADLSIVDLQRCLDVAFYDWDDDRRTIVEDLGKRLPSDPSRVAHALEQTRHGADWMIERWEGIRSVLRTTGSCDDDVRRLACDLKGVAPELRAGDFKVPVATDLAGMSALADREIARLRQRQELVLEDRDGSRRSMAMAAMPLDEDPETRRLRRYEAGIRRALNWAHAELRRVREEAATGGETPQAERSGSTPPMGGESIKSRVEHLVKSLDRATTAAVPAVAAVEAPAPRVCASDAPMAAPVVERPVVAVPVASNAATAFPATTRTSSHRDAGPRNRFEQRAEKARERKAARLAAKGR